MTPEELTQARVQEALRLTGLYDNEKRLQDHAAEVALAMARLIESDWKPVDSLLIEAREIVAKAWETQESEQWNAKAARNGDVDTRIPMISALAALKRGIEIGRQSVGEEAQ